MRKTLGTKGVVSTMPPSSSYLAWLANNQQWIILTLALWLSALIIGGLHRYKKPKRPDSLDYEPVAMPGMTPFSPEEVSRWNSTYSHYTSSDLSKQPEVKPLTAEELQRWFDYVLRHTLHEDSPSYNLLNDPYWKQHEEVTSPINEQLRYDVNDILRQTGF